MNLVSTNSYENFKRKKKSSLSFWIPKSSEFSKSESVAACICYRSFIFGGYRARDTSMHTDVAVTRACHMESAAGSWPLIRLRVQIAGAVRIARTRACWSNRVHWTSSNLGGNENALYLRKHGNRFLLDQILNLFLHQQTQLFFVLQKAQNLNLLVLLNSFSGLNFEKSVRNFID